MADLFKNGDRITYRVGVLGKERHGVFIRETRYRITSSGPRTAFVQFDGNRSQTRVPVVKLKKE